MFYDDTTIMRGLQTTRAGQNGRTSHPKHDVNQHPPRSGGIRAIEGRGARSQREMDASSGTRAGSSWMIEEETQTARRRRNGPTQKRSPRLDMAGIKFGTEAYVV
ncbi:hypothetical protein F442_07502 [Phytophthora nicotianae P10297]|uniref:Uncharacterized protein n=6 Tax=Phytophthora nicotianae TaxID=4792 RepID=W2ZGY1_PHYNI|nr:hypothetical protein F442_07502 [Phytophthora nicotianae P10297]